MVAVKVEDGAAEGVDCGEARGGVVGKYHLYG
jgi:hypothetical protein